MEALRKAAREHLKRPDFTTIPEFDPTDIAIPGGLHLLWQEISSNEPTDHLETCENLLVAQGYLKSWGSRPLRENDESAANSLYEWAASIALPSPVYAETEDLSGEKKDIIRDTRFRSTLAVFVLACLAALLPIQKVANAPEVILALASFASENDPWTTKDSFAKPTTLLASYVIEARSEDSRSFWSVVEYILKERIKPLFTKTRNPAITAAGRKNFHPIPLPRFDASVLDPETKPWKIRYVYATTVFSWVVSQYLPTDRDCLEAHFSLLVPPVLALIDDESLSFKTRGCSLLSQLLIPIRESKSDILRRTSLSSVFEEAVTPCLLSLPTITPEDDSLQLLGVAYPALLSLLKTSYQKPYLFSETTKPILSPADPRNQQLSKDTQVYIAGITKLLRTNLIPSFHHISSTNPTSVSSFASFPYPRLSTFLMDQIAVMVHELQIHATKYIQDLIPLIYSTLANPFGTAYPPLLLAATTAARAVVLNAHPRLWRWRGELLGGLCSCWLHVLEEKKRVTERVEKEKRNPDSDHSVSVASVSEDDLMKLKTQLKGVVYLLKFALQNPVLVQGELDPGQVDAKEKVDGELQQLVDADDDLKNLLFAEIDPDHTEGYF